MKEKMKMFVDLLLLSLFVVALISLSVMSWTSTDPEGKMIAALYLIPAVAIIALAVYLMTHKKQPRVRIHRITRQF